MPPIDSLHNCARIAFDNTRTVVLVTPRRRIMANQPQGPIPKADQQPTCQPHVRGLMLPCPHSCHAAARISLVLATGNRFYCAAHAGDFSALDVREFIEKWTPVLAWIDRMPVEARAGRPVPAPLLRPTEADPCL